MEQNTDGCESNIFIWTLHPQEHIRTIIKLSEWVNTI